MTIKAFIAQARRLKLLEGELCSLTEIGRDGAVLRLSFGVLGVPDSTGYAEAERRIIVECP